jgi:hypothetical protein
MSSFFESEYQRHKHGRKSLADRRAVGWGISSAGLFPTDKYFKPHLKFIRPSILLCMFKVVRKLCAMAPLLRAALEEDKGQENITFRPNAHDAGIDTRGTTCRTQGQGRNIRAVHNKSASFQNPGPSLIKAWVRTRFTLQI